jgi:hypothetical protein
MKSPPETNTIAIQKGIPMPMRRFAFHGDLPSVRATLQKMEPGDCFVWDGICKTPYDAAKQLGYKITVRKVNGAGYCVWLVDKNGIPKTLGGKPIKTTP